MTYIRCQLCGWSTVDNWEPDEYTPFRDEVVRDLKNNLFREKVYLDKHIIENNLEIKPEQDERGYYVEGKIYVAAKLVQKAKAILEIDVGKFKEWLKTKDTWICPRCGDNKPEISGEDLLK